MEFRVLGPLEALSGGQEIDLGAPKQRAVLAVLLLEQGRVVPTDRIIASVWGDDAPPSVSASLQAYLSNLRRVLRDGATIERRQPGYVLEAPGAQVDRTDFLRAADAARDAVDETDWQVAADEGRRALSTWRGPLLADHADEPWVRQHAAVLQERRADAAEHLVTGLLGLNRTAEAVTAARQLHTEEPFRERAAWLLIVALHRAGRSTEALETYRAHAAQLEDELGLEPPPALRALQVAVLRRAPELEHWPNATSETPVTTASPNDLEPALRPDTRLIGRSRELTAIANLFAAPELGGRWLVLSGPAGIGKTRLAEEVLAQEGARGVRLLRTSCPEDDGTPAWWPIRQMLRAGGVAEPDGVLTPPRDAGADAARFAVYLHLEDALGSIARTRTIVLIDDVQWADRSSLRWLRHLAESAPRIAIDFVLTVREGVESAELDELLSAVARHPRMRQVAVSPLGIADVGALASQVSGDEIGEEEAADLASQTGGNPFLIGEYARLPRDERAAGGVPVAVRSVLRRRLAAVEPEVLSVLRTAAVAGDELDLELLRRVTRLDRDELADLLADAAERELVVPALDGGAYRFSHGLLRDEVLAGLSGPRRQRLHARIAEHVTGSGQDALVRRASHLVAALPLAEPGDAYRACRAAADAAEERWQSESAAEWWAHALDAYALLPDQDDDERDEMLIARVAALGRAGRRQTVIAVVEAALLDAVRNDRIASAGRLAATLLRTSGIWPWTSFTVDPGPLLTRLVGVEPLVRQDPRAHARVLAALAVGHYYDPDVEVPERLSLRAIEIAERLEDPDVLADALLGRVLVLCGLATRVREIVPVADRLLAVPHQLEQLDAVLRHDLLTLSYMTLGEIERCEENLREGVAGADALRLPIVRVQLRWMEANLALWHGDLDRARELAALAEALHAQTELYIMNVGGLTGLARAWEEGRLEEMVIDTSEAGDLPWLRAAILLAGGHIEAGEEALEFAIAGGKRDVWSSIGEKTLAALLVTERRLVGSAEAMLRELKPFRGLVGTFGQTGHVGVVSFAMAGLAALLGRREEALALVAEARETAERGRGLPTLVRCDLLEAELTDAEPHVFAAIAERAALMGLDGVKDRASASAHVSRKQATVAN